MVPQFSAIYVSILQYFYCKLLIMTILYTLVHFVFERKGKAANFIPLIDIID